MGGNSVPTFYVFDIDGCLTFSSKDTTYSPNDLEPTNGKHSKFTQQNKTLFDQITFDDYILCGSSRIDLQFDMANAWPIMMGERKACSLSLFHYLNAIKNYTSAKLDKFLFSDLDEKANDEAFNKIEAFWSTVDIKPIHSTDNSQKESEEWGWKYGENFDSTYQQFSEKHPPKKTKTPNDCNKISLIYAIVQRIANEHLRTNKSGKNLVVKFYDDKDRILETLIQVYKKFPQLIPQGITLELYQYGYDGNEINYNPALNASIPGTGVPHTKFRETALQLATHINNSRGEPCNAVNENLVNQIIRNGTDAANEKRMLSYWYMIGTFVLLCSAAILMGLAAEEMIGVAFEDLGNSAKSDLNDKYAGQYLFSSCLFLGGGFTGYKAQQQYEFRETALERKSFT